jgi:preprotein translocase subunit SecG
MLYYLVSTIYVLVCFLLLVVVLLQQGKGGDMASAFGGGGSQTAFGARQGATVLSKATAVLGGLFMIGAIALAYLGTTSNSLLGGIDAPVAPRATQPATPVAPAPSPGTPAGAPPAAGPAQPTPTPVAPSTSAPKPPSGAAAVPTPGTPAPAPVEAPKPKP